MTHSGGALIDPYAVFEKVGLSEGMRVADLGCGRTGHFVFPASKVVGGRGIVYAVEIVKDILDSIRSRIRSEGFSNVETVWSDIEKPGRTPIPEGSLNVCFLINVLFMVRDRGAVLVEAARLLQKDGVVIIIDWNKRLGLLGPTPETMVKEEEIKRLAEQAGLTFQDSAPVGDYHFCLIFKKI